MENYLTYPFKTMRITQSYTGKTSHYPHTTGNMKDYPIDEGGKDSGRDTFYCPCDEAVIKKIYGLYSGGTNTIWISSTNPVKLANGKTQIITMQVTHPNDSDLSKIKVGQKFKRGEIICHEGTDGATGNHIHLSIGMGEMTEGGWSLNSNGKWVLRTALGTIRPEEAFFIDRKFTSVENSAGLNFKSLPDGETQSKAYSKGDYIVTTELLHVRKGPGTNYDKKTFSQFTKNAQGQIREIAGFSANGYVRGVIFTAQEIKNNWAKTPSGWVCLDYCEAI